MKVWLWFVLMAGLCWGTYVPLIAFGGKTLQSRYTAILCVGVAYFLIAILFPLARMWFYSEPIATNRVGWTFACMAGAAGALGALAVVFATSAADIGDRIYIAPLIFTLAPVINTLVSLFWHPTPGNPLHFGVPEQMPGWKLFVGVIMVGIGAGLILLSKEETEKAPGKPTTAPQTAGNT